MQRLLQSPCFGDQLFLARLARVGSRFSAGAERARTKQLFNLLNRLDDIIHGAHMESLGQGACLGQSRDHDDRRMS